jgi:phosphosulfolactate phosphohydrolase-like enzyme
MARQLFQISQSNLLQAASGSRNGMKLLGNSDLKDDVPFCLQQDTCDFCAELDSNGRINRC